ncbi:MAG TPA: hypothetical protein VFX96_08010 [Pyrinomonadaceae bacterium]|nr:hypothetical protein [Pyrinomonadaceae bacterium]
MKNVLRLMTFSALIAAFALTGLAQTAQPAASPAPAADANKAKCDELYGTWRDNRNGDAATQAKAYEAGKTFLADCQTHEYLSYVQNWVPKYEAALKNLNIQKQYTDAFAKKDWKGVVAAGKQITAAKQDDVATFVAMVYAATQYAAANPNDESLNPDAVAAARRALQLIDAGKADAFTPEQWKNLGFPNKNELAGWLNSTLGYYTLKSAPGEAAQFVVKAVQNGDMVKKDASTYNLLAAAYQNAEYAPLEQDYRANCAGKDLTDECQLKLDKMNLVVDRMIDALARAVALADANAATKAKKAAWMTQLENLYKFRHEGKTDGLPELIANIQSKPLLLPSMQTLPTRTPTAPATGGAASATPTPTATPVSNPSTNNNAPKPATNNNNAPKPVENPPKPKTF